MQQQLTSDLTEKPARPEMTQARLATCALRGEQRTAKAWPRQRRGGGTRVAISVRTTKREPRQTSGAKESVWSEVVEAGHDAGGEGS